MEAEALYDKYKPLLFSLAYRMLGSVMDSEDIVHDVFMEWERVRNRDHRGSQEIKEVHHVKAFLCKMVTNRCIDYLRSAKYRREQYFGEWLPEPVVEFAGARDDRVSVLSEEHDPLQRLLLRESISVAYLIMLEKLSPVERAIFLLREIFAFEFEEIAVMVDKKPDNCRKILSRTKKKLNEYKEFNAEQTVNPTVNQVILAKFFRYVTEGNVDALMSMMTENAIFTSDGGGKVQAAVHPILGRNRVIPFMLGIAAKLTPTEFTIELAEVNNEPGIVIFAGEIVYCTTMAFSYQDGQITAIYNTMNPDKLRHIRRVDR